MIGMISWNLSESRKGRGMKVYQQGILHMRFAVAEVPRGERTPEILVRRRVQSAARRLQKAGVVKVVLPKGFPYLLQLGKYGIAPVSTLPLRRQLAAEWVQVALEDRGMSGSSARVAVTAAQMTAELVRTVTELALRNRYVLLEVPYGGEELGRQLRREYGVSLLLDPTAEQMEEAEALVLFDNRPDLKRKSPVVLELYQGAETPMPPLVLPPALEEQLPEDADREQLLAALQEGGVLRPGQIVLGKAAQLPLHP